MDDKTWQQVNLGGSTFTVRGHQSLHAQNLFSLTGSHYPGAPTNHWQRMTCCNRFNALTNSQSISSQHQCNQIQQQVPLQYFQIQKPANNLQYGNQISSVSLTGQHHHGNQTNDQQHFAHLYTVLSSATSNDSSILEKSTCYERENATITQSLSLKTFEGNHQIFNNHNNRSELSNHSKIPPNLIPTVDKSAKYQIFTNFVIPETSEESTFSIPIDHVITETQIDRENRERHLPPFVNIIEAVPDMLREVRPGSISFLHDNDTNLCFLVDDQDEFSYHASKPELRIETTVASMEIHQCEKNWPELSLKNHHRSYASIIDRKIVSDVQIEEKTCLEDKFTIPKDIKMKESDSDEKSRKDPRYSEEILNNLPIQKTYADAVQLIMSGGGGRHEISSPRHVRIDQARRNIRRIKLPEESSVMSNVFKTPFREATSKKMAARCTRKKREYESCVDDNDNTTMFISNEFEKTKNHNVSSWRKVKILKNDITTSSFRVDQRKGRSPSRKRMCKMAEMYCLEELDNDPTFFRAFDDYNSRIRRMSYTRKFDAKPEVTLSEHNETLKCKIRDEVTLITGLTIERENAFFSNDHSTKFQTDVACLNNPICEEILFKDSGTISQFRVDGMMDRGVFKVLQKLKECADGTGALYTNSWRPEEIHFLRRCYRDKMSV